MKPITTRLVVAATVLVLASLSAQAQIPGVQGTNFSFTAKTGTLSTPEGGSIHFWGFANNGGTPQYPGPTMILNEGDTVTVDLANEISVIPNTAPDVAVSLTFPGQANVTAEAVSGSTQAGLLTQEALPGGVVRYSFTAPEPGTYMYHSATDPDLQVAMGLVGAIIVRPTGYDAVNDKRAYASPDSAYDREVLFMITEMDPIINKMVEFGRIDSVNTNAFFPVYWFFNGRCAPDTMFPPAVEWLPSQPYNCMPMIYPGEKLLMRTIGAGRDMHPFHHHGNNADIIARDGRLLSSDDGATADLKVSVFTIDVIPGQTADAIFSWTGAGLGWDIYGHSPEDPLEENEDPADHGKPFPVLLPEKQNLAFGGFWSGSPYLGGMGNLPPGEGGLNPTGGYTYMWHSHNEKEMVNNDVFPGGCMTMLLVVPPGVPMPMDMMP